ncbi:MAG: hypothetical protein LBF84_01205, partial [Holosporales bacterium]|nr:hypothetical protein [Holosporales bacterium]
MTNCPKCGANHLIKYGASKEGDQRYQCKKCKSVFKDRVAKKTPHPKAKPESMKALAILLYTVGAMSLRGIAKILKVS